MTRTPDSAPDASVRISTEDAVLRGDLVVPSDARGLVLFAHGSGSGRLSPRNRAVATVLQDAGLATLLFDLLTEEEEEAERYTAHLRFDIGLLTRRLSGAIRWALGRPGLDQLSMGYFGASTGAAAALRAAATLPDHAGAVVSRGGRPDLAGDFLAKVSAPTLLIVGGDDREVLALNRLALDEIRGPKRLEVVPGATHLFEEPGATEAVARLARDWFLEHLAPRTAAVGP